MSHAIDQLKSLLLLDQEKEQNVVSMTRLVNDEHLSVQNRMKSKAISLAIRQKKHELSRVLDQLSELQGKAVEISEQLDSRSREMFKVMLGDQQDHDENEKRDSHDLKLNQCLVDLHTWIGRVLKELPSLKADFDQFCIMFVSSSELESRESSRELLAQAWAKIFDHAANVKNLKSTLMQWKAVVEAWEDEVHSSYQIARIELLSSICDAFLNHTAVFSFPSSKLTAVYYNNKCARHIVPSNHYENSQRFYDVLVGHELLCAKYEHILQLEESSRLATFDELMYAHSEKYITTLKQTLSQVESTTRLDGDTYVCPDTLQSCLAASGAVLQAVDSVMKSDSNLRNSFCIVRPPGHHAGKEGLVGDSVSQGFCLVNNIAIGAYYALKTYPDRIKRVAIVDIDVHHGDGTQHIVAGNNDILFISLHAYDGEFYPRTGSWEERAECTNILNIPLEVDFNADIFFRGFMAVGYPALVEFQPDMIFVSAGFDARKGDSLTPHRNHLGLIDEDYYKIALKLGNLAYELCHGRLVSALEGGYGSEFLAQCTVGYSSGLVDASLTHWIHTNLK